MTERVRRITVVEDDLGMRQAIARLLAAKGYEARLFDSAESALADDPWKCDCCVFDAHLPGMSGHELRDELARRGSGVPVVVITAHDTAASRERARASGCAYLAKPFQGRELLEAIANAIERGAR